MVSDINRLVQRHVIPILKDNPVAVPTVDYIADGVVGEVNQAFSEIQDIIRFDEQGNARKSGELVNIIKRTSQQRASDILGKAGFLLPDMSTIIRSEGLEAVVEVATAENAQLITKMAREYIDKIQQATLDNFMTGKFTGKGGIIKEIQRISGVTKNRAKLIARDQSNKIHSRVVKERSQAAGSIGYRWHNMKDRRVRGNPAGLYPDSKYDHWEREGEYYLWEPSSNPPTAPNGKKFKQPPKDGAPGESVNCRCYAEPVFEVE